MFIYENPPRMHQIHVSYEDKWGIIVTRTSFWTWIIWLTESADGVVYKYSAKRTPKI